MNILSKINTIHTENLFAVIGREEVEEAFSFIEDASEVVWISITDPHKNKIEISHKLHDSLHLQFYDVEESWSETISPILDHQGKKIKDFILKNKNKRFLINCEAGQSRSAAIALAIEYLFLLEECKICNTEFKWSYFPSKILVHERYIPNTKVFFSIIGKDEEEKLNTKIHNY